MNPEARTSKLVVIVDGEIGKIKMKDYSNSTYVRISGKKIIPQGEYLLTDSEELKSMILSRLDRDYSGQFKVKYY